MTFVLLGAIIYISSQLSSTNSPTQIKKSKAAAITYSRTVDFAFPTEVPQGSTPLASPTIGVSPTSAVLAPTKTPTSFPTVMPTPLVAAPTLIPTLAITVFPTIIPTAIPLTPTRIPTPTLPMVPPTVQPSPTTQPLLAYNSITPSPTLIPIANTGGMIDVTKIPSPTKKISPTGVQALPETGWIQTSSILFIVAVSTIFFSLLF